MENVPPVSLNLQDAIPYFQRGAALLDVRPKQAFVELHVPGSIHFPPGALAEALRDALEPGTPVVLLLDREEEYSAAATALARAGFSRVVGYLAEGIDGWQAAGLPVASGEVLDVSVEELGKMLSVDLAPVLVDVREKWEWTRGHVPGAVLIPMGQLSYRMDELDPQRPIAVICEHGSRSQVAAAALAKRGFKKVYNVRGGTEAWVRAGHPLAYDD